MNEDERTKRLSQGSKQAEDRDDDLLAAASHVAARVLESVQTLAGTTCCKGVQINELRKFALTRHCWLDACQLGIYSDRGSENEVYLSDDNLYVY